MDWTQEGNLILFAFILVILGVFLVLIFMIFIRRKNQLLKEQEDAQQAFNQELARTQIEIREATLRNISWELHDNIGQIFTLAKIQAQNAQDEPAQLEQAIESLGNGLTELRALSKLINPEALGKLQLNEALGLEVERFNRLGVLKATFTLSGKPFQITPEISMILFRIIQEFFTNSIKYSKATELTLDLKYDANQLIIQSRDNGVGFNIEKKSKGIGINNMRNRAALIGAQLQLKSTPDNGTALSLTYNNTSA
ncbi:MAG: ATP-binding protein [Gilvibacter sp.]